MKLPHMVFTVVQLQPLKSRKYLFHVPLTRRSKVRFAPAYFLSATENDPSARSLALLFRKKSRFCYTCGLVNAVAAVPLRCQLF